MPARRRPCSTWRTSSPRAGRTAPRSPRMSRVSAPSPTSRTCRCRRASPRACARISSRASTGCSICGQTASAGCSPMTWGLGKTAQTIAHIAIEEAAGRLDRPALVVVPTSLVPNWTAELARFAPHLRVVVLHGLDRHERRRDLDRRACRDHDLHGAGARHRGDGGTLPGIWWCWTRRRRSRVPTAKATHAVCRLDTRHRLCLSGTPIENNLGELWSQFAFLMPGLLGSRKSFTPPLPHADREGRRPGPSPPARDTHPAIHPAAHESGGGDGAAAEAHHPAPNHARPGAARAVRDHPRDDA